MNSDLPPTRTAQEVSEDPQWIIAKLRRQQAALADFGSFAFGEADLQTILTKAAVICAAGLEAHFAKICRYRAAEDDLLVVAGCGWRENVVGYVVSPANESSTQGRAYVTGEPVILEDVSTNNSFALPSFYAEHGIVATVDVLIKGRDGPWGVLEVDSEVARKFDRDDVVFLTGFANVLAEGAAAAERRQGLRDAAEEAEALLAQKERLLLERNAADLRMHEMQSELLRVTRLNAMGQMTAAIAHELNQPLAAISNYISAVRRTLESGKPDALSLLPQMIDKAADQTKRAGDIIRNLRNFVERREGVKTSENLAAVVHRSLAMANFTAVDEEITVTLHLDETLSPVTIDVVQVQQILINLIRNSVEAMRGRARRELSIVTERSDVGCARVTVRDSGPGLTSAVRGKLFQPFLTTKSTGLGLGLTICEVLVSANGGRISLVDGLDGGAGFAFTLPLTDSA